MWYKYRGRVSFLTYKLENRSYISCRVKIFLQNVRRKLLLKSRMKFLLKDQMKQCPPSPRKEKSLPKDRRNDRPRKRLRKNQNNNLPFCFHRL
jgi:hypothetical protein